MFDPNIPALNEELTSAMFRRQFQGLKTLIDALPAVTAVQVQTVQTLPPGAAATAEAQLVAGVLRLSFGIPQGEVGATGAGGANGTDGQNGQDGAPGEPGLPGPPGEVTLSQLAAAISGTSANSNLVQTLENPLADPNLDELRLKLNELILALRR